MENVDLQEGAEQAVTGVHTKLGIHRDIIGPFIGLVTVSTIAWVTVLILLNRD